MLVLYLAKHMEKDIWCKHRGNQGSATIGFPLYSFFLPFTFFAFLFTYHLLTHPTVFLPSYFWVYMGSFGLGCLGKSFFSLFIFIYLQLKIALLPFGIKEHYPYWRPWHVNQLSRLLPTMYGVLIVNGLTFTD